jgi:hypothetical protein
MQKALSPGLKRIIDYLGEKIAGKVGKGLSPEQKRIIDYLGEKIVGDVHVVPAHWILIDLYGLDGEKDDPYISHHLTRDDRYPAARASFYRSILRLMDRGIAGRKVGRVKTYAWHERPEGMSDEEWENSKLKETHEVEEWGYYLRTAPTLARQPKPEGA